MSQSPSSVVHANAESAADNPLENLHRQLTDLLYPQTGGTYSMVYSGEELAAAGVNVEYWMQCLSRLPQTES